MTPIDRPPVAPGAVAAATAVGTVGVLPAFLTGALAVQVSRDLGFGVGGLGLATASFALASAATSVSAGRVAERLGAARAMRLAVALSAVALTGVAALADSLGTLIGLLLVAGAANALAQPAANLHLARAVPRERLGLAFGVKQSAIPMAALAAGVAVPAVALTVGWRWAYAGAAAFAVALAAVRPARRPAPVAAAPVGVDGDAPLGPMLVLAAGAALGSFAGASLAAFLVAAGVATGLGAGTAGWVYALSSAVGIATRLGSGLWADRAPRRHLRAVAVMMAVGAAGFAVLAVGSPLTHVVGAPMAFAAGWGWPSLFVLSVVRANPGAPAAASGITQAGAGVGQVLGPATVGLVVAAAGYRPAWLLVAAACLGGAVLVALGRRWLLVTRARRAVAA